MSPSSRVREQTQQGSVSAEALAELARFGESLGAVGFAQETVEQYLRGARLLLQFLARSSRRVEDLTAADLGAFVVEVQGKRRGPCAAVTLVAARRFLRTLCEAGRIRKDQVLPVKSCWRAKPEPVLPPALGQARSELQRAMDLAGLAPDTRASYSRAWREFLLFLDEAGLAQLGEVTREVVSEYRLALQSRPSQRGTPLSSATQHAALAALRFFFAYLVRTSQLLADPTAHLPSVRRARSLPRVPSEPELKRLLSSLPQTELGLRDRAALELLYGTGIRGGELVRLDLGDVDLQAETLLVRLGKGRKDRLVPFGKNAKKVLVAYLKTARPALLWRRCSEALFVSRGGARLQRAYLTRRVKELGARVRLSVRPHLLRHACATHLLRGRADIRHIQRLLGHKSLSTTERYTRVEVSDLKAVIRRCHPRERRLGGPPR